MLEGRLCMSQSDQRRVQDIPNMKCYLLYLQPATPHARAHSTTSTWQTFAGCLLSGQSTLMSEHEPAGDRQPTCNHVQTCSVVSSTQPLSSTHYHHLAQSPDRSLSPLCHFSTQLCASAPKPCRMLFSLQPRNLFKSIKLHHLLVK